MRSIGFTAGGLQVSRGRGWPRRVLAGMLATSSLVGGIAAGADAPKPGSVDPTYGTDGITVVPYGENGTHPQDAVLLPDGRTLVAGTTITSTTGDAVVMAFTADGQLDTSFNADGTPGVLQVDMGTDEFISDVALDMSSPFGPRVVIAGSARRGYYNENGMAVARVWANGELDTTFGEGGVAFLDFVTNPLDMASADAAAFAVDVRPDGGVVLGGYAKDSAVSGSGFAWTVTALDPMGMPDLAFQTVREFVGCGCLGDLSFISALAIDTDGSIVAVRTANPGLLARSDLLRIPPEGGTWSVPVRVDLDEIGDITVLAPEDGAARGRIIVGGSHIIYGDNASHYWGVVRHLPDLSVDTSFGDPLLPLLPGDGRDILASLEVLADGKLLLGGSVGTYGAEAVGVGRLLANGQLDETFGTEGRARVSLAAFAGEWGWAAASGDRIVVAGATLDPSNGAVGVSRLLGVVPSISVSATDTVTEGSEGTATVTVSMSEPTLLPTTVGYETATGSFSGEAVAGVDYVHTSGTLTFAPGETTKTFDVTILGVDTVYDGTKLIPVRVTNPSWNATLSTTASTRNIVVHDDEPVPRLIVGDFTVVEGSSGTSNAVITVTQTNPCAYPTYIDYGTTSTDGATNHATPGFDYTETFGYTLIPAGELTATFTVPIIADTEVEADEVFDVYFVPSGGPGLCGAYYDPKVRITVTIDDDDLALAVVSVTPNGTGVSPKATVSATFSKPVPASAVTLTVTQGRKAVRGIVTCNDITACTTVTFTPSRLARKTSYIATVSVAAPAGPASRTWTFTTGN